MFGFWKQMSFSNLQIQGKSNQELRFTGFDFLRAFFSIAILGDHSRFFTLASVGGGSMVVDILYANVGLLAVPVFFQISLFLLFYKIKVTHLKSYFKKRMRKLLSLYLFWVISFEVFNIIFYKGESEIAKIKNLNPRALVEFVVSGGNSPFYFFFSLLFITAFSFFCTFVFRSLENLLSPRILIYSSLFLSLILLLIFSSFHVPYNTSNVFGMMRELSHWAYNPLNFLPYIFTSMVVCKDFVRGKFREISLRFRLKLSILLSLFLIFTFIEWIYLEGLIHYSRLSLVFGSWLLLYISILSTQKVHPFIKFISDCSLGIYAIHLFFTHVLFKSNLFVQYSIIYPEPTVLTDFALSFVCSVLLTLLFRKNKFLEKFV